MPRSSGFFIFVSLAFVAFVLSGDLVRTASAQRGHDESSRALAQSNTSARLADATTQLTGAIVAAPGGRPFRNVEVTLLCLPSGATLRTHTDAKGRYHFNGIVMGIEYVITPYKQAYLFTPGALVVTPTESAAVYDFTAELEPGFTAPSLLPQ